MTNKRFFVVLILLCFFLAGCFANNPKPSPSKIKTITAKPIEGEYEDIFNSCIAVFEEKGFEIKYKDMGMDNAIILASFFDEKPWPQQFWQRVWYGYIYNKGVKLELSCKINKVTDDYSDVKISIQETNFAEWGSKKDTRFIYEKKLYKGLFEEIKTKIKK